jgi:prolyl-tRNA synthetase
MTWCVKADLAEQSAMCRGCMVIKPHGYAIWEKMQARPWTGCSRTPGAVNAYFPLFIPKSPSSAKEAEPRGGLREGVRRRDPSPAYEKRP